MKRHYHSLLTKPIDLFCTNALIYTSVESFHIFSSLSNWPLSIILTTCTFRILLHPLGQLLDKTTWKLPSVLQSPIKNLHKSFFLNDLEADVHKLNLTSADLDLLQAKVKPNVLVRQSIQSYFCLNFARGLSDITLNNSFHAGMCDPILYFWTLTGPDPLFIAPLISGLLANTLLISSFHPFTLPLTKTHKFWAGFLVSLACIPLPLSYNLSFWSFVLTHLALKKFSKGK